MIAFILIKDHPFSCTPITTADNHSQDQFKVFFSLNGHCQPLHHPNSMTGIVFTKHLFQSKSSLGASETTCISTLKMKKTIASPKYRLEMGTWGSLGAAAEEGMEASGVTTAELLRWKGLETGPHDLGWEGQPRWWCYPGGMSKCHTGPCRGVREVCPEPTRSCELSHCLPGPY